MSAFQYKHLLGNESIQAYLRSFIREKSRWNDLIEATLLYGIHCLSQNYSLQTLSVDQVQQVTRTVLKKPQHYFVLQNNRQGSHDTNIALKPSSAWRNGNKNQMDEEITDSNGTIHDPLHVPSNLPVISDGRRDVEEYKYILGKELFDSAWNAFIATTGYPSQKQKGITQETLETSFDDLQMQSAIQGVPFKQVDSLSFIDFLRGFVVHCIKSPNSIALSAQQSSTPIQPPPTAPNDAMKGAPNPRVKANTKERIPTPKTNVPSKVKKELDARKQQVLRVRKTNTQRMHEALAKSRLATYEAATADSRKPRPPRISDMSPGTKALEIAHLFATSSFLDDIPHTTAVDTNSQPLDARKARLELYAEENQTIKEEGCLPAAPRRQVPSVIPAKHDFKGWLGDYGPPHTKTVVPATWTELEDEDTIWLKEPGKSAGNRTSFNWNFESMAEEVQDEEEIKIHEDKIDPAFEWLVHDT